MNNEILTNLAPKDLGSIEDPSRPFLSLHYYADQPHRINGHVHPRAQVLFPSDGVYRVRTSQGSWVVPPSQAIWIPSHVFHEIYSNCAITSQIFFVDEAFTANLPTSCTVISISPLLREMFNRAVELGNDYEMGDRKSRFFHVLLDELALMTPTQLGLPLAKDKRVRAAMDRLMQDPTASINLDDLADSVGASSRTLERLFLKETGMSFRTWRNTLRLQEAIENLAQGMPVTDVAMSLGYSSVSAFIAMFKRKMGVSPGKNRGQTTFNSMQVKQ